MPVTPGATAQAGLRSLHMVTTRCCVIMVGVLRFVRGAAMPSYAFEFDAKFNGCYNARLRFSTR